ncbi:hypothetical protein [Burkholderia multivorans]|uniref:hypothetical protein n=1 Tax=Burkholderia multivorans TaxID=87883 RepID=UPI0019D0BA57|nr:hypothetical protein [Burkholderia multivorans]MBN6728592.1 hypothetical protein [Burkholderia multivorans]MBN6737784.1 hypothetical protein [Burkholderia multivorans]MBN7127912.1 hypothetical protein [Burkholderia multivorans]MBN8162552.1 hypothetical protein [Burkholderia multivorans]MBN8170065.1 hypothetical protein [Burkholderia multivorans]
MLSALKALRVSIREDRQRGQRIAESGDDGAVVFAGAGSGLSGSRVNDSIALLQVVTSLGPWECIDAFFALTERRMAIARFGAGLMCGVDNVIGIRRERLPFIEFIDVDETRARPGYRRPAVREKLRRVDGQRAIRPAAIGRHRTGQPAS